MGYNIEDIQSKTKPGDIADRPVLGTTYRAEFHGKSVALVEEEVRRQVASKLTSKRRRPLFGSATRKENKKKRFPSELGPLRNSRALPAEQPEGEAQPPPGTMRSEWVLMRKAHRIAKQRAEREAEKAAAKREREEDKEKKKKAMQEKRDREKAERAKVRADKATRRKMVVICSKTIAVARPVITTVEHILAYPGAQTAAQS